MEQPHNLLTLVLQQHYNNRPVILRKANGIIREYTTAKIDYEQTLSKLYQLMKDLPSDILLYYLTTIPLPKSPIDNPTSVLPALMKQMLVPSYHNSMRPVLLKYLNTNVPPLVATNSEKGKSKRVRSVIDENIEEVNKKKTKCKKPKPKKRNIPSLASLCATDIFKNYRAYCKQYKNLRKATVQFMNSKKCERTQLNACQKLLKDTDKKLKWLKVFKSGNVPIEIISEEYGNSDIFYLERHLQHTVGEDILDITEELTKSINLFINKCETFSL